MEKRKLIRVFLIFCILILSNILIGCNEHTEEDFIEINKIGEVLSGAINNDNYPTDSSLERKITETIDGKLSLYKFVVDVNNIKYLAGYYKEAAEWFEVSSSDVKWIQYNDINEVKTEFDSLELIFLYAVLDGKFKYDYLNDSSIDLDVKYFYKCRQLDSIKEVNLYDECAIWADSTKEIEELKNYYNTDYYPIFVGERFCGLEKLYEIVNVSNKEYIKFEIGLQRIKDEVYIDYTIDDFGTFYNQLNNILIKEEDFEEVENYKNYYGEFLIKDLINLILENRE